MSFVRHGRITTIVGSGGIGKTRLAIEMARKATNQFPAGIWFAPLESISDPEILVQEVAGLFVYRDSGSAPLVDRLLDFLSDQRSLLIFDNCEHLLGASAALVNRIAIQCHKVQILATSRENLGTAGEVVVRVQPLSTPGDERDLAKPTWLEDSSQIGSFEAVRLFLDRALHANPSFRITEGNLSAVCDLANRLDGIPLAIELAAARARTLTAEQLLARLNDAFAVCGIVKSGAVNRQKTLRATIDWSYNLLIKTEKLLLRRLAQSNQRGEEARCSPSPSSGERSPPSLNMSRSSWKRQNLGRDGFVG